MPFDLFLSRASSFAELDSASPLSLDDLGAPPGARAAPHVGYWLEHPGGEPWMAVTQRGPDVVLDLVLGGRSVDTAYLAEIEAHSNGLGVDFYRWVTS